MGQVLSPNKRHITTDVKVTRVEQEGVNDGRNE